MPAPGPWCFHCAGLQGLGGWCVCAPRLECACARVCGGDMRRHCVLDGGRWPGAKLGIVSSCLADAAGKRT